MMVRQLRAWLVRFGELFRKERGDRDLAAEMESHLQMHIEDNLRAGMSPAEARRQALMKLGGVEQTKEIYGDRRGLPLLETFFQDLRFAPILGRNFLAPVEHTGNDRVALITHSFWKERLGGDPGWVGRTLTINGQSFTVVGILPRDFRYVMMRDAQIFIPLNLEKTSRGENFMSVIGRIKPGVSLHQAQNEMDSIARALEKEYPADDAEQGTIVIPMLSSVGHRIREALLIMLAAVGLVLLIACANVGNLLLAQGVRRRGEIAVRSALGASVGRLVRQRAAESVLLSFLGCALGLLAGHFGLQAFRVLSPGDVPRLEEVQVNLPVLLFSLGILLIASILLGLVPAARFSRVTLAHCF